MPSSCLGTPGPRHRSTACSKPARRKSPPLPSGVQTTFQSGTPVPGLSGRNVSPELRCYKRSRKCPRSHSPAQRHQQTLHRPTAMGQALTGRGGACAWEPLCPHDCPRDRAQSPRHQAKPVSVSKVGLGPKATTHHLHTMLARPPGDGVKKNHTGCWCCGAAG